MKRGASVALQFGALTVVVWCAGPTAAEEDPDLAPPRALEEALTEEDLLRVVKEGRDLREIEALIYARRGRPFVSPRWRAFAAHKPWYRPEPAYTDARLTAIDRANLALLGRVRQKVAPRPPVGPPDPAASRARAAFPGCPPGTARRERGGDDGSTQVFCWKRVAAGGQVFHGPAWTWLPTGRLGETRAYADGKEQGPFTVWSWTGVRKEEGAMQAGARDGVYRRFFPSGTRALDARYERGAPAGRWSTFYGDGRPAIVVDFSAGAPGEGRLPNGKPWPAGKKVEPCDPGRAPCGSPLERLDLASLPPVIPPACPEGARRWTRRTWRPVLEGARAAWARDPDGVAEYEPHCVREIGISCAPDLDGAPGNEVVATIAYRILINGENDCGTKDANNVWEMTAEVVLSPPLPGPDGAGAKGAKGKWKARGLLGYSRFEAGNGGNTTTTDGFVRLPSGEVALRVSTSSNGGDCDGERGESVLVWRDQRWTELAGRTLATCDGVEEPEAADVF